LLKRHETIQVKNILAMLTYAFGALDIKVEVAYRPDKSSMIEANIGAVNGDFIIKPHIELSSYKIEEHPYTISYISS
jgi:hypothetical protein